MLGLLPRRLSFFIGCWYPRSQRLSRFMATAYKRATLPSFWYRGNFTYVPPAFRPIMWHVVRYILRCRRPFVIASSLCRKIQQTWTEELEGRRPVFADLTSISNIIASLSASTPTWISSPSTPKAPLFRRFIIARYAILVLLFRDVFSPLCCMTSIL
jgi:hypothetical protein